MVEEAEVKEFLETADLRRKYQRIELPFGYHTPGKDRRPSFEQATKGIDLTGKSYMDIGCMWGAMCFYAEEAGAAQVYGIDRSRGFVEIAKRIAELKDSHALFYTANFPFVLHDAVDVVSLFNVIHHHPHPFQALHGLCNQAGEYMIIEFPTLTGRFLSLSGAAPIVAKGAMAGPFLGIISQETGLYFTAKSMEIAVNWFGKWEVVHSNVSPFRTDRLLMTFRRRR